MKLLFFVSVMGVILFAPAACRSQEWNIIYEGDYVPTNPAGTGEDLQLRPEDDNVFDPVLQANDGAQVPTGSASYLHFEDNVSAGDQKWDEYENSDDTPLNESFANGGTMVMRVRREAGAVGVGDVRCFDMRSSAGDRWAIRIGQDNGIFIEDIEDGGGAIDVGNINTWNAYRFTFVPEGGHYRIKAYINGNTTAAADTLTNWDTGEDRWKMGSGSDETGEYDLDWLLVTDDGAFPPGSGPLLPPGFDDGYTGPWEPTWTAAPPTPTPQPTPTNTPCVTGYICNAGFDEGILPPWVHAAGTLRGPEGPSTLCDIDPHTDGYMHMHASSGGQESGTYYQEATGFPGSQAVLSCYIAVDCNPDHEEYCQIGIDPTGGTDPAGSSIVWSDPLDAPGGNIWVRHFFGPVSTAPGSNITVWFRHVHAAGGGSDDWNITAFDSFHLQAIGAATPVTGVGETWEVYK